MDDQQTRDHIQQHADSVVRGDMDAVVNDFTDQLAVKCALFPLSVVMMQPLAAPAIKAPKTRFFI